jgi:integral membrane protein (TIGR01906 family)
VLALRWAGSALFVAAMVLFLVLSNVRVAALEPRVYGYSFSHYDVSAVTGIDRAQLDMAARDIVSYFRDDRELLTTRVVIDGAEQPLYTPKEALHMRDVKALFGRVFRIHELAFAYLVAYVGAVFLWSRERSLAQLGRLCVWAGALTVGLLALAAVATVVGFDTLFRQFHLLSFANDFWELDPARDHLVQMFPQGFWFDVTLAVGVASMLEGALLALLGLALRAWLGHGRAQARRAAAAPAAPAEAGLGTP